MTTYRIICTEQEPADQARTHAHIVTVGTGANPDHAEQRWTLEQVLTALDQGDSFYTEGLQSGMRATVQKYVCTRCKRTSIRSSPDAVVDNNLDSLRRCQWRT